MLFLFIGKKLLKGLQKDFQNSVVFRKKMFKHLREKMA